MAISVVALTAGFLLKAQCLEPWDGRQYARLCYNDIQPLYGARGLDEKIFPYVSGDPAAGPSPGIIEYPVLTGVFMWATSLLASDANEYLRISALLLAPFGLVVAYLLGRLSGWRALMWAGAPALALYSFHNWDLLAVAAVVAGFWAWHRGRPLWAAALFGVGAALKLYPLLFLLPLALTSLAAGARRESAAVVGVGGGVLAGANLPFALLSPAGWWSTYSFHRQRGPNWDNVWMWGPPQMSPEVLNALTFALVAAGVGVALIVGWRRSRAGSAFPFVTVSAAMLVAFLLFNKVHSPQYALWLLPFFALVRVHVVWWLAYSLVDVAVYVGVFRWFYDFSYVGVEDSAAKTLMIAGVWGRAFLLVALFVVFLRARDALAHAFVSHPRASVVPAGDPVPAPE